MRRLVAVDLPGSSAFVSTLERSFDAGDAVLPIDQRLPRPAVLRLLGALRPSVVVDRDGEHDLDGGRLVEEGDALVMPTSGTTGDPKGVVLTHAALAASAAATSERLSVEPSSDRWLCCLPLSHVGGMSVVTRALITGTPVEVHPGFDKDAVTLAVRQGVTLTSLVPTALWRLDSDTIAALRAIVLGGSAPPSELPSNTVTTYGLTESGSGLVYDGTPLTGAEVEIAGDGEILLRGPMMLRAYRDGRDPKDPRGFFSTGDLGELDESGRLTVFGRSDDVIVSGGEMIWPTPVEQLLQQHPGVQDVTVVGVADPEWQHRAVACVVPSVSGPPTLEELRALVRDELGAMHAPRELALFDALPRTSIGKIRRSAVVDQLLQRRGDR